MFDIPAAHRSQQAWGRTNDSRGRQPRGFRMSPRLAGFIAVILTMPLPSSTFATEPPSPFPGTWRAEKVPCQSGADEKRCREVGGTLVVAKGAAPDAPMTVKANLYFTNGHTCSFLGSGKPTTRRLVAKETESGCVLTLAHEGQRLVTSTPTPQACRLLCGSRGTWEGVVLRKTRTAAGQSDETH